MWLAANRLQLNHEKTEALWCSSARRQHQISTTPVQVGCIHLHARSLYVHVHIELKQNQAQCRLSVCLSVVYSSSSSRNEYYLGGIIALLLQDHRTMLTKSVCI